AGVRVKSNGEVVELATRVNAPLVEPGVGSLNLIELTVCPAVSNADACSVTAPVVATGPSLRMPPAPMGKVVPLAFMAKAICAVGKEVAYIRRWCQASNRAALVSAVA